MSLAMVQMEIPALSFSTIMIGYLCSIAAKDCKESFQIMGRCQLNAEMFLFNFNLPWLDLNLQK